MHDKKKGYAAIQFTSETKQEIIKWSRVLKEKDLVTTTINGKTKEGLMVDKLHLTLLYGLDDEIIDTNKLTKFLKEIKLTEIKVDGVGFFPVKEYDYRIAYLKIKDEKNELKKINENLKKFPMFSEHKKSDYTPHVTIAYVKKDFSLDVLMQKIPKILYIHDIQYFISSTSK